jgi:hypothetical protein
MAQHNAATGPAIPYVSFSTFGTALDYLKSHGTPDKIDSSVFPNFSGGSVSHLLLSMRFLGVIDDKGHPQAVLSQLVDEKTRKTALAKILPQAYAPVFQKVDLSKASPSTLDEALRAQKVTGATHRKAKAFLLKAAQFAGLPISNHLMKRTRSGGSRNNGTARKAREESGARTTTTTARTSVSRGEETSLPVGHYTKTIKLPEAGGTLVLSGDFDPFALRGKEREFVYQLADMMSEFGAKRKAVGEDK